MPPSAISKRPFLSSCAPVKLPFLCPNSSLSSRFSGIAAQFWRHEELPAPARAVVHGGGDELLSDAGLALDEHRDARVDHLRQLIEQRAHRRAVADDLLLAPSRRAATPRAS